ncbi:MAG: DegT/DnrJ/EryC1/StrS family aminotransferase, partial [Opitutales bacterium]|nr:DegT/DnrJ/EryC1/StrS family aminotransferase [Opitutales bacterium]
EVLDVGVGDDVLVTPRSFLASVSCVVRRGARPVFADVDRMRELTETIIPKIRRPQATES